MQRPLTVAAFDVDGTITTRDCVLPFLTTVAGRRKVAQAMLARPRALLARDRDAVKASLVSVLAGRPTAEIADAGRRFFADRVSSWLRPDTVSRVRSHREQGHRVVLVSASLRPYLAPLAEHLGAEAVLCCELEQTNEVFTGRIDGPNCRGPEKVVRLRRWLGGELDHAELWAYGDSSGDNEMLAAAHHRFRVRRDALEAA